MAHVASALLMSRAAGGGKSRPFTCPSLHAPDGTSGDALRLAMLHIHGRRMVCGISRAMCRMSHNGCASHAARVRAANDLAVLGECRRPPASSDMDQQVAIPLSIPVPVESPAGAGIPHAHAEHRGSLTGGCMPHVAFPSIASNAWPPPRLPRNMCGMERTGGARPPVFALPRVAGFSRLMDLGSRGTRGVGPPRTASGISRIPCRIAPGCEARV
jgi:hypothetical protein